MKKPLLYIALIIMLAGCATEPENTAPPSAEISYKDMTCDQLSQEQHRLLAALAAARDAQRSSSGFVLGGNFDGIPIAGINKGSDVDKLKDQLQELQQAAAPEKLFDSLIADKPTIFAANKINRPEDMARI